ncbi:MAG: outer membrane beta-barrel protein [Pseudomonadota bacterium]|nr:outer membrane beta-barrel protein [Pseudomonadota bacterium]
MKFREYLKGKCLTGSLMSVLAAGLVFPAAQAQETSAPLVKASSGTIVGIVTNAAKLPITGATVTATRTDGGSIRATISGSDGIYSFADLAPGTWSLTVQVDGYPDSTASSLQVVAGKAMRRDMVMNVPAAVLSPTPALAAALPRSPAADANAPRRITAAAPAAPMVPEALQAPEPGPEVDAVTPFANVGDIGWLNGNSREKSPIFDTKFFTPEIRLDVNYLQSLNHPIDHTVVGSTEVFRSSEFQIEQVSFGGDFHWNNVRARFLSMYGMFATTTPRNDASGQVGQWQLQDAYRYFSEANAGYHFDVNHGLNIDAGVFVSYIGLFSYYNFDNWTYQPSYVSSNTPWFFNGLRVQWFPTQNLKIEPWLINGWQSYAKFNRHPGFGGQILWMPNNNVKLVFNSYGVGQDNLPCQANNNVGAGTMDVNCQPQNGGNASAAAGSYVGAGPPVNYANVTRVHEDDSLLVKYYDAKGLGGNGVSKMAFSLTWDWGCEYGGGVHCTHGPNKEEFLGVMLYDRTWFHNDLYAVTVGGGFMNNPGRYLALTPPINGATAASGSPYFTQQPGQKLYQWDAQVNLQYMPNDWITWWAETTFRHSSVPYWSGPGGITPPGGNNGLPASCVGGGADSATGNCSAGDWFPDLRSREVIWGVGLMVKF